MKTSRLVALVLVPLLASCLPKVPEIPMTEAPAGPLVQALEEHSRSFSTLKAIAGIRAARRDRRRSFDNVGILVNGQKQFRIEAFGPLGESLVTLLWDGNQVMLDLSGERRMMDPKNPALERILGADVDPADLCTILSGNVPGILADSRSRMLCAPNGSCVLELTRGATVVKVRPPLGWELPLSILPPFEVYRGGTLVYQVRYESIEPVAGYSLPRRIVVENPEKRASLVVDYAEADVNGPLDAGAFTITGGGER
ncbi:MAG TPA: hypothetical protein VL197_05625 [Nitrospirota bacterium]|nr:hypothetical protein [Nitrospirota bacterium]